MDPAVIENLLKAIRDAVTGNRSEDDVVLPPFDPEKNDNGAESWCNNIDTVAKDRGWSGITTVSKSDMAWLSITMFMISKLMASLYFTITYMYTSELFPTYTRNSMHALCSSLGRVGSIVAPQTPLLTQYWEGFPSLVFGISSIIAGMVTFLVPDIANDSLPDTVKEAEALGIKEKPNISKENVKKENQSVMNRSYDWKE